MVKQISPKNVWMVCVWRHLRTISALVLSQSQQCMMGKLVWRKSHRQKHKQTKKRSTDWRQARACVFCSSAPHLFIAKYIQRTWAFQSLLSTVKMNRPNKMAGQSKGKVDAVLKNGRNSSLRAGKKSWTMWVSSQIKTREEVNKIKETRLNIDKYSSSGTQHAANGWISIFTHT